MTDVPDLVLPTWPEVVERDYRPWDGERLVIDTAGADVDECVAFVSELSRIIPVALGIAPFCSKRNTPLDRMPYAGVDLIEDRLNRLRTGLKGRADVRATSAKWA